MDLEGARDGGTPNFEVIRQICRTTGLKVEIGGGIRSLDVIARYLDAGVERVILGTQAVTDPEFLEAAVCRFGSHAAVGVDLKEGPSPSGAGRRPSPSRRSSSLPGCAPWGCGQ